MRTSHFVYIGISLLLLASCKEETEKPKVIYDASKVGKELTKTEFKQKKNSHLPKKVHEQEPKNRPWYYPSLQ